MLFRQAILWAVMLILTSTVTAQEQNDNPWPREIVVSEGTVVIYQPQPEKLSGNVLSGRAAIGLELNDREQPMFGAIWFEARLETDRSDRTATLAELEITNIRIPIENEAKTKQLEQLLETELPKWNLPISLDNLAATLEIVEDRAAAAQEINTAPPQIVFATEPSVLILIDGKPELRDIDNSKIQRVINTPFTLLYEKTSNNWYLYADENSWYTAKQVGGPWAVAAGVPSEVNALAPSTPPEQPEDAPVDEGEPGPAPKIVVATEPTELISINGKAEFSPIAGTNLLYVSNTDSDLLMDINGQNYYVLLAGRWYTSKDLKGGWTYTRGENLPTDFKSIPEESDMSTVLYAVPGTQAAQDAVMDTQIPQTAAVDRSEATLEVEYDGSPTFKEIEDTELHYAVNTATPVIRVEKKYYAVDEAIWFVADKPTGQWLVATDIPAAIYAIPPDSPLYNVTFVNIYKVTDETVYVGYTQGYTNTYVYNTTVVYGTGYYYPGWYGSYYYPRPSTWGFHVRYSPWGGWSFGLSYSNGPFTFYMGGGGWYRGGWWGPARYRGYHHGYRHGYHHGYRRGYRAGYAAGNRSAHRNNIYKNQKNIARTRPVSNDMSARNRARSASNRANNVYADRSGNVYRDRGDGWDKRNSGSWQNHDIRKPGAMPASKPAQRPATQPDTRPGTQPATRPAQQQPGSYDLNRSRDSRAHGHQRTQSYNRSSRPSRGGGRRR